MARVAALLPAPSQPPGPALGCLLARRLPGSLREPVIWDAAPGAGNEEIRHHLQAMANAMDTSLPLIDLGCGNGAITRRLTEIFPSVLGVDVSPEAVAAAQSAHPQSRASVSGAWMPRSRPRRPGSGANSATPTSLSAACSMSSAGDGRHASQAPSKPSSAPRARIYLVETNVPGGALSYLRGLGATGEKIPGPLRQAISALPKPGHFGAGQRSRVFPADRWTLIAEGPTVLKTVPMEAGGPPGSIPAYWAVLAPRPETSGQPVSLREGIHLLVVARDHDHRNGERPQHLVGRAADEQLVLLRQAG